MPGTAMRVCVLALFLLVAGTQVIAATRGLDSNWQFTDENTVYQIQWPPKKVGSLWKVVITTSRSAKVYTGFIANPDVPQPLAKGNRRGSYTYYRFGQPVRSGQYDDTGHKTGIQTFYRGNGQVKKRVLFTEHGHSPIKTYYASGQLQMTVLPDTQDKYARSKHYNKDGSLGSYKYTEQKQGKTVQVTLFYDDNDEVEERDITWPHRQVVEYLRDGVVRETRIHDPGSNWWIKKEYNAQGELQSRHRRLWASFEKDGLQIEVSNTGVRTELHYNEGQRDGLFTRALDGKLLARGRYDHGQRVGDWFSTNRDANTVTFKHYGGNGEVITSYTFGRKLVERNDQGIPQVPQKWVKTKRRLPPVGTIWLYQTGDNKPVALTLKSVGESRATYDVAHGKATLVEDIDTYRRANDHQLGIPLKFPLSPGKEWSNSYTATITVQGPNESSWQYRYRANAYNQVLKVERITVGAGTFTTYLVDRRINWTKDQASGEGFFSRYHNAGDGVVSGSTRNLLWYAPKAGRVILRAHQVSGWSHLFNDSPEAFLNSARTMITELVGMAQPDESPRSHEARYTSKPPHVGWIGFKLYANDTWEYLMVWHTPE